MEGNMTRRQKSRVVALSRRLKWKKASSPIYKSAPHEYCSISNRRKDFIRLALMIKKFGEYKRWRKYRFKFLTCGRFVFWWMQSVINRSYVESLDHGGYPSRKDRRRIFKRFWGGK